MSLTRRSFMRGLIALPMMGMFLNESQKKDCVIAFKKFGTESSHFDGKGYIYIGCEEKLPGLSFDKKSGRCVGYWDGKRWTPIQSLDEIPMFAKKEA